MSPRTWLPAAALGLLVAALPARAASTSAVSISDSVSTSVGSVSDSLHRSSDSSSRRDRVAEGEYRIVAVAALPARGGEAAGAARLLRLTLQRVADPDDILALDLPQALARDGGLAPGRTVALHARPYGWEFAHTDGRPFFLVLEDAWRRDLASRPVSL